MRSGWYAAVVLGYFAIAPMRVAWLFVKARRTRRTVRIFIEAPAVVPDDYTAAMIESACANHAFTWRAAGVHVERVTTRATLLRSPDGSTIASIIADERPKSSARHTFLRSHFADGTATLTGDVAHFMSLDRSTRVQLLMNADFDELWRLHSSALAGRSDVVAFAEDVGWNDLAAAASRTIERLVDAHRAQFENAAKDAYHYTWRGAFLSTIWFAVRARFNPPPADRRYKRRPSKAGGASVPLAVATAGRAERG